MDGGNPVTLLMFFTLTAGIVIGAGAFLYFLRRQRNRWSAQQALIGTDGRQEGVEPDGALLELIGVLITALVVMALLLLGYSTR